MSPLRQECHRTTIKTKSIQTAQTTIKLASYSAVLSIGEWQHHIITQKLECTFRQVLFAM